MGVIEGDKSGRGVSKASSLSVSVPSCRSSEGVTLDTISSDNDVIAIGLFIE